jgi:hypothetical protein
MRKFFKWLCNRLSSYSLSQRRKINRCIINGSVYKNDEGKVLGIVIVARDVTKKKQAALYTEVYLRQVWILLLLSMPKGKLLTEIMH